jgi:hypothetical protein
MKKLIFILMILIFCVTSIYGELPAYLKDKDVQKKLKDAGIFVDKDAVPEKDEVVILASVTVTPEPDNVFFSKYWKIKSNSEKHKVKETDLEPSTVYMDFMVSDDKEDYKFNKRGLGNSSAVGAFLMRIPSDHIVKIISFTDYIANLPYFPIRLPLYKEFTIPEDAKYIYIGSFIYNCEGTNFDVKNIWEEDRYDEAVAYVKKVYGESAKVVRVPLRDLEQKKDKEK